MDYKKMIKSRENRMKILNLFSWVPDKIMIKIQYRIKLGRKLNLKNPQRYTEKLQWYKLNYKNPIMKKCVDKYEVRKYIKEIGCSEILNELYGIYNSTEEIDFDKLPNSFVIKDTLGGGGNSVIIVKDKSKLDIEKTKKQMNSWMNNITKKNPGREWVYDNQKHRIIIEKFIDSNIDDGGLIDYKFFCFSGKVEYVYGIADRKVGKKAGLGIFDKNFNLLPYHRLDEEKLKRKLEKPKNYDQMIKYAERLSENFPHARIDLYNIDGKIIFGEITFFDGSGYFKFQPDNFDYILGRQFNINKLIEGENDGKKDYGCNTNI